MKTDFKILKVFERPFEGFATSISPWLPKLVKVLKDFEGFFCYSLLIKSTKQLDGLTLAQKLGDIAHVSPLLRKILQMTGCPADRVGDWLLKCAVQRGATHYQRDFPIDLPPDQPDLSDEEIGIALCLGEHPYNSALIRAAAQLLSSSQIDAERLTRLAVMERVEPVLLYIAQAAARFVPDAQPWEYLRVHLPERKLASPNALPHWSRFVIQTGVTPFGGGPAIQWLWRRESTK